MTTVDVDQLRALLEVLNEQNVAEFEHESEGTRLRIVRTHAAPAGGFAYAAGPMSVGGPPMGGAAQEAAPAPVAAPEPTDVVDVTSPFVGTF